MATIVEKLFVNGEKKNFILLGSGRIRSNYASSEEPYIVVCNSIGEIEILEDFSNTIRVISIDGKTPKELLSVFTS